MVLNSLLVKVLLGLHIYKQILTFIFLQKGYYSSYINIKENKNLDSLEESDDEEEFENIKDTKYIKNKEYTIECVYMNRYKLWKPLGITDSKDISLKNDIIRIEKNNKH